MASWILALPCGAAIPSLAANTVIFEGHNSLDAKHPDDHSQGKMHNIHIPERACLHVEAMMRIRYFVGF